MQNRAKEETDLKNETVYALVGVFSVCLCKCVLFNEMGLYHLYDLYAAPRHPTSPVAPFQRPKTEGGGQGQGVGRE